MKNRPFVVYALIFMILIQSLGGLSGGLALVSSPDGIKYDPLQTIFGLAGAGIIILTMFPATMRHFGWTLGVK